MAELEEEEWPEAVPDLEEEWLECHTLASHALECCIMFTLSSET